MYITQILSECSVPDGTEDYYSSQNEENEDKNRYSQILPSKLKSTPHAHGVLQTLCSVVVKFAFYF